MAKTFPLLLLTLLCAEVIYAETNPTLDGSRYYGLPDKSVEVELVTCPDGYQSFKGIWTGDFQSYDQKTKAFRPFKNKVTYDGRCYSNPKTGDKFVVGERVDTYPEYNGLPSKIESSLLITGTTSGDNARPFLRTVDKENGLTEYHKVFEDKPSEMSVWEYQRGKKENQPEMKFRVTDFQNILNETRTERIVFVTLTIGPVDHPYWQGVVAKGSHARTEE